MYEASFGLSRRPFSSLPQPEFYFPAAAADYARQTLIRCVERGEGVAVVVGPTGCGKSLLGQMLAEHFRPSMHVVRLASGRLDSRRALLQAILFGLGRSFRQMDEGELRLSLTEYLSRSEDRRPMLLIADEAEALPLRLLDELRMTTNLSVEGEPCSRLVLLGGPTLEERLTDPRLESFSQRIVARCYLEAMNRTETRECIQGQLAAASASNVIFATDACDAVYQATDGVPRLINQLCDHAMILAFADGRMKIDRAVIEEAWADLQQLPTPWNSDSDERSSENIIEFGGLEGDDSAFELSDEDNLGEAYSVPALRVTPDENDLIAQSSRRLDGIEKSLERLDEDFQPAGSIGPEVELVFHDPADLLSEDFQEEELIVDRYSRTDSEEEEASIGEPTYLIRTEELHRIRDDGDLAQAMDTPATLGTDTPTPESPDIPTLQASEQQVVDQEEVDLQSTETHTLDIHSKPPVPKLKHADFARLFSNLRRTAQ
jgi:type II secretory pathway predicted ATPase ExeA